MKLGYYEKLVVKKFRKKKYEKNGLKYMLPNKGK